MDARILIDHRESRSTVPEILKTLGISVEISGEQATDYIIGRDCGIERKTVIDFYASILDRRIFSQANDLATNFLRPIVLLEGGGLFSQNSRIHANVIRGIILWLSVKMSIPVIRTGTPRDTAEYIRLLAGQTRSNGMDQVAPRMARKRKRNSDRDLPMLCMIDGIGKRLANRVISEYGSIAGITKTPVEELSKIEGIGQKRAAAIKKILYIDS